MTFKRRRSRRNQGPHAYLSSIVPLCHRKYIPYAIPFSASNDWGGLVSVPDSGISDYPGSSGANDPTFWYPLTAQIPYNGTPSTFITSSIADQAYRYTRRIRVTRIHGLLFVNQQRPDTATRFVIGQYHQPAPSHCVGGLFQPSITGITPTWSIPGSSRNASGNPGYFYGLNNAFVESETNGSQTEWPTIPVNDTFTFTTPDAQFHSDVTPGPFNSLLTFHCNTTPGGSFNKQLAANHVYGSQYNFLTGAGPDFTVLYATTINTLNALDDDNNEGGGNKSHQQIQFDIHPNGPITEFEVFLGPEVVGSVMGGSTTAYGIASGAMPGRYLVGPTNNVITELPVIDVSTRVGRYFAPGSSS